MPTCKTVSSKLSNHGLPPEGAQIAYEQLDQLIFKLFNLTSKEQDIIKHAVDGENKFLF